MDSCRTTVMLAVILFSSVIVVRAAAGQADAGQAEEVVARFVEYVEQHTAFPKGAANFVARQWQDNPADSDIRLFIPESLAVLYPRFKRGLEAHEAYQYEYSAKIMGELSLASDPYLASHAALFQTKALVEQLQFEYATVLLNFYFRDEFDVGQYSLLADEMKFLQAYCLFHTFESRQAKESLEQFLEAYPQAGPNLRAAAKELLAKLDPPPRKTLGQAAHLMADAGLWLTEGETGLDPQISQKKAMMILEELIHKAQQQEQQQQQCSQGGGQQATQGTRSPQQPASASGTPSGESTTGRLHAAPRAAPGEVWGRMKPQERDRILQVLQENFPSRYRQLVEQYYRQLAGEE